MNIHPNPKGKKCPSLPLFGLQPIRIGHCARSVGTRHSTWIMYECFSSRKRGTLLFSSSFYTLLLLYYHHVLTLSISILFFLCTICDYILHFLTAKPLLSQAIDFPLHLRHVTSYPQTADANRTTNHASHKPASDPRCLYRNPRQRCFPKFCDRDILQSTSSSDRVSSRQCCFHSS